MTTFYGPFPKTTKFDTLNGIYVDTPDGGRQYVHGVTNERDGIRALFAPHYTYESAVIGVKSHMESKNFRLRAKNAEHGKNVGKKIDREISKVVIALARDKLTLTQFLNICNYKALIGISPRRLGELQRMYTRLDTRTKFLLASMESLGIRPLASELPVACVPKRRGAKIDHVGFRDAAGRFVTINFKTHVKTHYDMCTRHPLSGPFYVDIPLRDGTGRMRRVPVSDSQRNQDVLQVLSENLLFRTQLKLKSSLVESIVMRVDADGVETIPIPDWARRAEQYVWSRL